MAVEQKFISEGVRKARVEKYLSKEFAAFLDKERGE